MYNGIYNRCGQLGVTFNSDKLGGIDFTKISKLTMCSAGAFKTPDNVAVSNISLKLQLIVPAKI